jgi:hypothetical protein
VGFCRRFALITIFTSALGQAAANNVQVTPVVLNFHSDAIFQKLFQNAPENSYQLLLFMLEIYTKHGILIKMLLYYDVICSEPPSEALVDCIQELYARQKYPADILIPVITKLPKVFA